MSHTKNNNSNININTRLRKMNLIAQSKSITNITQIFVFCAVFFCLFQMLIQYLKRYPSLAQSLPANMYPSAVIRILSTFHSTLATLLSIFILYYDNDLSEHKLIYSSFMISFTLNFSIGFLAFDFLMMLIYRHEFEWNFVVHHFVSIVAFYCCSTRGVFPYIALFRLTSEGSTPFLNLRWFLLTLNKKTSKLYLYNGVLLVLSFFIVRICTIFPNWYTFFSLIDTHEFHSIELKFKFVCVLSCVPLDALNLFWFSKIINILAKSIRANKKPRVEKTKVATEQPITSGLLDKEKTLVNETDSDQVYSKNTRE